MGLYVDRWPFIYIGQGLRSRRNDVSRNLLVCDASEVKFCGVFYVFSFLAAYWLLDFGRAGKCSRLMMGTALKVWCKDLFEGINVIYERQKFKTNYDKRLKF